MARKDPWRGHLWHSLAPRPRRLRQQPKVRADRPVEIRRPQNAEAPGTEPVPGASRLLLIRPLPDRALHVELDEAGPLDGVLHGQGAGDGLDEAVDDHAHGLLLRESPAHQVEELVLAHLGDGGLVAHPGVALADLHVGIGVGPAVLVEDEGVAAHVGLDVLGPLLHLEQAPVRRAAAVLADRLGHDGGGGLGGGVDDLGPRVLVHAGAGVGHREHLTRGLGAHEVDGGVLHRQPGPDVAVDPLHPGLGLGPGPLGDQVVDVGRPVLDRRVGDVGRRLGDQLDHCRVEGVGRVHGGGAALDVVHRRTLVGDDQRALELAHVLGVDPEVGLQRHLHVDARGHVDERPARPHRGVQRRELVVAGGDDRSEVLLEDLGVLTEGRVHVHEQDALLLEVLPVLVVDDLGLVLGGDAGQVLALGLGDAQLLVGLLDRVGQLVPRADLLLGGLDVIEDVLEVEVGHVHREPRRHGLALEELEGPQPELAHPVGLALHPRHLVDDVGVQALLGLEDVVLDVVPPELVTAQVEFGRRHQQHQLPRGMNFSYVDSNKPPSEGHPLRTWPLGGVRP